MSFDDTNIVLLSEIRADATLELRLDSLPLHPLALGEVRVRMEAAPINPSDMGLLLASADLSTAHTTGSGMGMRLTADLIKGRAKPFERRIGLALPIGNEGTGTVVEAAPDVRHMMGQKVAIFGGAMFVRYRTIAASDCLTVSAEATPAERAALFVNPLTALAMVDTMRMEGHRALIHTAAASNLGQILVKICNAESVDLVNIVRGEQQVALLKDIGAHHVVDSTAPDFKEQLNRAIGETRATIAFDAIGGGQMANMILHAMEASELRFSSGYSLYGTDVLKQIYIYGSLDLDRLTLDRGYGYAWSVSSFLLTQFLNKISPARKATLLTQIAQGYNSTFASTFSREVHLADLLNPEILAGLLQKRTGEKYLLLLGDTQPGDWKV
tara:strand:+ start:69219 stop:70370 length:1152 start_codon:yes stop_codon:yes gene_type:complete